MDPVSVSPPAPPALGALDARRIAILIAAVLLANLPLLAHLEVSAEEGRRLLPARAMLETDEWVVPQVWERSYLAKPPLFYWCVAATAVGLDALGVDTGARIPRAALFGPSEWAGQPVLAALEDPPLPPLLPVSPLAARLPAVLATAALGAIVYLVARRAVGPTAAMLSACCAVGAPSMLGKATLGEIETVLVATSFAGSALACFGLRGRALCSLLGGALIGAAVLAKGPIAYAFALAPVLVAAGLERQAPGRVRGRAALTAAVALAVPGVWLALLFSSQVDVDSVGQGWAAELARKDENAGRFDYPLDRLRLVTGVFYGWFPASLIALVGRRSWRRSDLGRFAVLSLAMGLALLLVWPGVRVRYALPLLPWIALLAGIAFERVDAARRVGGRTALGLTALLTVATVLVAPVALFTHAGEGTVLARHGVTWELVACVLVALALAVWAGRRAFAAHRSGSAAAALAALGLAALGGRLVERVAIEGPKLHDRQRALGAAVLRAAAGEADPTVVVGRWAQFKVLYYTGWRARWGDGPEAVAPGALWVCSAQEGAPGPAAAWELLGAPAGSPAAVDLELPEGAYWVDGELLAPGVGGKDLRALALWRRRPSGD